MERKNYYTANVGNHQKNEIATYLKALEVKREYREKNEIHFLARTEAKAEGYLNRIFKNLEPDKNTTFRIVTPRTVDQSMVKRIIISYGLTSEELFRLDQLSNVSGLFAHQWRKEGVIKWARTWEAVEVLSGQKTEGYDLPSELVTTALTNLTLHINLRTGIDNPHDEELARSYVKALYMEEGLLPEEECMALLVGKLDWKYGNALKLVSLMAKLNEDQRIMGGNRMKPDELIRNWKKFPETIRV